MDDNEKMIRAEVPRYRKEDFPFEEAARETPSYVKGHYKDVYQQKKEEEWVNERRKKAAKILARKMAGMNLGERADLMMKVLTYMSWYELSEMSALSGVLLEHGDDKCEKKCVSGTLTETFDYADAVERKQMQYWMLRELGQDLKKEMDAAKRNVRNTDDRMNLSIAGEIGMRRYEALDRVADLLGKLEVLAWMERIDLSGGNAQDLAERIMAEDERREAEQRKKCRDVMDDSMQTFSP